MLYSFLTSILPSTDQEMIPVRNAIDAHAQDFVVHNEFLLSIVKVFAQYSHLFTTRYLHCFMFSAAAAVVVVVVVAATATATAATATATTAAVVAAAAAVCCSYQ